MEPDAPDLEALGFAGRIRPLDRKLDLERRELPSGGCIRVPEPTKVAPVVQSEGAGIGLRANMPGSIVIGLEAGKPLTREVATSGNNTDPRYFFSLSVGF